MIQGAGDTDVNSVPDLRVCSENAAYMNDICDDGDYPMGLNGLNKVTRCRVVDKNVDSGRRGCPMDFSCPSRGWTDHAGHVQLMGCVLGAL